MAQGELWNSVLDVENVARGEGKLSLQNVGGGASYI